MTNIKLCFFFQHQNMGEGFFGISKIVLSPQIEIPPDLLFRLDDEVELNFRDFKMRYEMRKIKGAFKVIILNKQYIINPPLASYAKQIQSVAPGSITQFQKPECIYINTKQ